MHARGPGDAARPRAPPPLARPADHRLGGYPAPTFSVPLATGFGAGTRDPQDRPICLRLVALEADPGAARDLLLVKTDVDHVAPEYLPSVLESLLPAGAVDATAVPVSTEKGRPGLRRETVRAALLRAGSAIGVSWW